MKDNNEFFYQNLQEILSHL